jgi:hypothetical protein
MRLLDRKITQPLILKMRNNLLVLIFILLSVLGYAQSDNAAKIEYENAEEAFANKNYSLALEKIKKTEQLLNKENPKTQYMTIMILNSMANQYEREKQYQDAVRSLEDIEPLISKYLYFDIADQQKYRDVYNINETITAKKEYIKRKINIQKNRWEYLKIYYENYDKVLDGRGLEQIKTLLDILPNNLNMYVSSLSEKQKRKKISKDLYNHDKYYYKGILYAPTIRPLWDYKSLFPNGKSKFENGKFTKIASSGISLKENYDVVQVEYCLTTEFDKEEKVNNISRDFMANFMKLKPDFQFNEKYQGGSYADFYVWYFKGYSLTMKKCSDGGIYLDLFRHFADNEMKNPKELKEFTIEGEKIIVSASDLKINSCLD